MGDILSSREDHADGSQKKKNDLNGMRKAQSVANVANREPKQAWNARLRDDAPSPKASPRIKRKPKRKPRPASAYSSVSSQDLSSPFASTNEVSIFDDTNDSQGIVADLANSNKAVSMIDLSPTAHQSTPSKSKFLQCKFCCKIFTIYSISIHEKKCRERGQKENSPKAKAALNGRCVSVHEIRNVDDEWLKAGILEYATAVSVDKLNVTDEPDQPDKSTALQQTPGFLPCHVCGKPFGSKSLRIHIPQCEKKWEREHTKSTEKARLPRRNQRNQTKRLFASETNLSSKYDEKTLSPSVWYGNRLSYHTPSSVSNQVKKQTLLEDKKLRTSTAGEQVQSEIITKSGPHVVSKRPTSAGNYVACQFCNNYYGSASVKIHEVKCAIKTEKVKEEATSKNLSRTPRKPITNARKLFGLQR